MRGVGWGGRVGGGGGGACVRDAEAILCARTRSGVGNFLFLSAANKRFFKRASDIVFSFLFAVSRFLSLSLSFQLC